MNQAVASFLSGDYLSAARGLPADLWQHWASLALIGRPDRALQALKQFTAPQARFHTGIAAWLAGDDDYAVRALEDCEGHEHASRLAALIRKAPIVVAAQLPWPRRGSWDIVGELRDPVFRLHNISFHDGDIPNRPYADVRTLLPGSIRPDFYVAGMIEWHLIPPNLRELGCPVIGLSSDFDLHIQVVAPWLQLFDEIVVLDRTEWDLMKRLVDVPVSVYPKSFGVPATLPDVSERPRPVDVFLSGTVVHPYHPDKEELVAELLGIEYLSLRMINGFDRDRDYYARLNAAKAACAYVRHPGAMPTRGLEALAMGCVTVVQRDSALRDFLEDDHGVVPYAPERGALPLVLRDVLGRWEEYRVKAQRGAAVVRREFALPLVASQYLRFLTVLAARPRAPRQGPDAAALVQKRPILQKGWLPTYAFGGELLTTWGRSNVERLSRSADEPPDVRRMTDCAREVVLMGYHQSSTDEPTWLPPAISILEDAIERFPRALVPRLNLVRCQLHFGSQSTVTRGLERLDAALAVPLEEWTVDPLDDVMPWDFFPTYFNYRAYFDLVTRALAGDAHSDVDFARLIVASLYAYRSRYAADDPGTRIAFAAAAVRLDPAFAEYGIYYARLLLERGTAGDLSDARRVVQDLASRSARVIEIFDLARQLPGAAAERWYARLELAAERFWRATEIREYHPEPTLRPATDAHTRQVATTASW